MRTNSLMVVGQPGRFGGTSTQMARRTPASPMVLQHFMQILGDLSQKVNAIAVSQEKALSARQTMARPVESREVQVKPAQSSPSKSQRQTKVDRSKMRNMFD